MTFQVISGTDTLNTHPILPELLVIGPDGNVIAYNVHEFESGDSTILDVTLTQGGTYYVGVDALLGLTTGSYELFMYSFATSDPAAGGDTLIGGGGNDTIVTSSGDDTISFQPNPSTGMFGNATVLGGSGHDVVNLTVNSDGSVEHVTATGNVSIPAFTPTTLAVTASATTLTYGQSLTLTATASTSTLSGSVDFFDVTTGNDLGTATLTAGVATLTLHTLPAGTHAITATYIAGATAPAALLASQPATVVVAKATPTVSLIAPGGGYTSSPIAATATISPSDAGISATLEDRGISLDYRLLDGSGDLLADLGAQPPIPQGSYSVIATFGGSADYTAASATATFMIGAPGTMKTTPTVTWATPAAITYGTALDGTQLDASGSVNGTVTYSEPAGTVLHAGTYTLTATFTPSDTTDYTTATQQVQLVVDPATLTAAIVGTPTKTYDGTTAATLTAANFALSGLVGSESFTVTQTVGAYDSKNTSATTVTASLSASDFTAGDGTLTSDYVLPTTASGTAKINAATVTVSAVSDSKSYDGATASSKTPTFQVTSYNSALGESELAADTLYGSDAFTTLTQAFDSASAGSRTLIPTAVLGSNYIVTTQTATGTITPATPTVTWATPAAITYGTALDGTQLDASGSVNGTVTYSEPPGTVLHAGTYTLTATFTPSDTTDYTTATQQVQLVVDPATLTATIVGTPTKTYDGTTAATLTAANFALSGLVGSDSFTVTQTVGAYDSKNTSATTVTASLSASDFTAAGNTLASDYVLPTTASGTAKISPATTTTTVTDTVAGSIATFTVVVAANAPGGGTPTGTVAFFDATTNTPLGSPVRLSAGTATLTTSLPLTASQQITATYTPDVGNFTGSNTTVTN